MKCNNEKESNKQVITQHGHGICVPLEAPLKKNSDK